MTFATAEAGRNSAGPDSSGVGEMLLCQQRQKQQGRTSEQGMAYCSQYLEDRRRDENNRINREIREEDQQRKIDEMHDRILRGR